MLDIYEAILYNGGHYPEYLDATNAFQEVVSDLYDGFLSEEDRSGVKRPDVYVIPPIVKWGDLGPYTYTADATAIFNVNTAIVNIPAANARSGLLAWALISHEVAGHDILNADIGLTGEISKALWDALYEKFPDSILPRYWVERLDETASDVLAILNMGPAAGVAFLGYSRALNSDGLARPRMSCYGDEMDEHPADVLRGYLAASVIRQLSFEGKDDRPDKNDWADFIEEETGRDCREATLGWDRVQIVDVKDSAEITARIIATTPMKSLEDHSLRDIQDWMDHDEAIVELIQNHISKEEVDASFLNETRNQLNATIEVPQNRKKEFYAAHVVSAAVIEGLKKNADLERIFNNMVYILKMMHIENESMRGLYGGERIPRAVPRGMRSWGFRRRVNTLKNVS